MKFLKFKKVFLLLGLFLVFILQVFIHRGIIEVPNLISIFGFELRFYSLLIILAIFVLLFLSDKFKDKDKLLKKINIDDIFVYAFIPSIICARLWHIVTDWHLYTDDPIRAVYIWNGGLGIMGAVLGAMLGIYFYSNRKKINYFKILNLAAISLPLAQAIGRYGNLLNQEIFGRATALPWGLFIRQENRPQEFVNSEFFHPSYLYEQIGTIILFCINYYIYKKHGLKNNYFIVTWLIGYGMIRFVVEFFRLSPEFVIGLSFSQIVAIIMIISGILWYFFNLKFLHERK